MSTVPQDGTELLGVEEVAERLGVSLSTVWRRLRRGEFPSIRRAGRRLIPASALDRVERGEVPEWSPLTREHPLWALVGAFDGGGVAPGSGDKHAILADANQGSGPRP